MSDAKGEPAVHDGLLLRAATEIGRLHRAGLCHGRPHPRDFVIDAEGRFGFLDFEEDPQAVMPLASAQGARHPAAFLADCNAQPAAANARMRPMPRWASRATPAAVAELSRIVARLAPLLTAMRAVQRVKPGQDVARFIAAIETLQRLAGPSLRFRLPQAVPARPPFTQQGKDP